VLPVFRGVDEAVEVRVRVSRFVRSETFVPFDEKAERFFGRDAGARVASDGANGEGEEKGEGKERKRDAFHWVKFLIVGVKGRRVELRARRSGNKRDVGDDVKEAPARKRVTIGKRSRSERRKDVGTRRLIFLTEITETAGGQRRFFSATNRS
jgi:hypothetical protein